MDVQIISQVILKPSSPTPSHLKIFKLSLLDQLIPAPYAPIVLFYPNYNGVTCPDQVLERVEKLKQSLTKTLTLFYPLAGTIKDDLSIECDDKGAYFVTTKVDCQMFQFLNKPDLHLISKFLPCDLGYNGSLAGTRVTNVQVNLFECGGIAIGLCISHKILDGAALKTFLKCWAGAATGRTGEITGPNFVASSLFPANDLWLRDSSLAMWKSSFKIGKSVTKRFVFDAAAITTLKAKATSSGARCPTRVETISAILWKCSMAASEEANCGFSKSSMLTHVVNLRKRAAPTLSENSIGNLIWISSARCLASHDMGLPALADQIQYSISKINGEYVKKLHGSEGSTLMRKSLKEIGDFGSKEEVDYLGFSSWCGFGFYDIDFGWGKPVWVSSFAMDAPVFMNLIILMETRYGDGIEAWVTLDQQEMDILQQNHEIMAFSSLDPSPLNL